MLCDAVISSDNNCTGTIIKSKSELEKYTNGVLYLKICSLCFVANHTILNRILNRMAQRDLCLLGIGVFFKARFHDYFIRIRINNETMYRCKSFKFYINLELT